MTLPRLAMTAVFALAASYHALFFPGYEAADEAEHVRYIEGMAQEGWIHPVAENDPYRWGFEVFQPPLYYALMGRLFAWLGLESIDKMTINIDQNPNFIFIRHDLDADRFPFLGHWRSLRILRFTSVILGLCFAIASLAFFDTVFPESTMVATTGAAICCLIPNSVHIFGSVTNDALALTLGMVAYTLAYPLSQTTGSRTRWFCLGILCGLGFATKVTFLLAVILVLTIVAVRDLNTRQPRLRQWALGFVGFALVSGPLILHNLLVYHEPIGARLLKTLTPAFYHDVPINPISDLSTIVGELARSFAVDFGYQVIQTPATSVVLFAIWVAGFAIATRQSILAWKHNHSLSVPDIGAMVAFLGILAFELVIFTQMANIQIRHAWILLPLTLLPWLGALGRSNLRRVPIFALALVVLTLLNLAPLPDFESYRQPLASHLRDADYHRFHYTYVRDPARASAYLRDGDFLFPDLVDAYQSNHWPRVLVLAARNIEAGRHLQESAIMGATAALKTRRWDRMDAFLDRLPSSNPESILLRAQGATARQGPHAGRRILTQALPRFSGPVRDRAKVLIASWSQD